MNITEQNASKMTNSELVRYRAYLIMQLSDTVEYLHKANLETNARYDECAHITSADIQDACARNGINI